MKCLVCKYGTSKAGRTTVTVGRDGTIIVIDNVPADVSARVARVLQSKSR